MREEALIGKHRQLACKEDEEETSDRHYGVVDVRSQSLQWFELDVDTEFDRQ